MERAWVNIGDDCFSPKSNATDLHVDTMYCNGTHGQSMGSIGQYDGEKSFIRDVVVENVWMLNGQHGARLKTWAGQGVGYGFIDNITFRNFWNANNEYSAFLDACYFNVSLTTSPRERTRKKRVWGGEARKGDINRLRQINSAECAAHPSNVNITNVLFENFTGYTSGKYGRAVARLTCSPNAVCSNIRFSNFDVTSPCGPAVVICDGIGEDMGIPCFGAASPEGKKALADKCKTSMAVLPSATPW